MLDRVRISICDTPIRGRNFAEATSQVFNSKKKSKKISANYLGECEALRGIAILLVVLFHAYLQIAKQSPFEPNMVNAFILAGNTGVTLFFVLSAFLLNLPFMEGKPIAPQRFFLNRALRILPMYLFVVLAAGIYHRDLTGTAKALLFLDINLSTLWPFGSVWWSLAAEVQFYLLLPWLHLLWRSDRLKWLLVPIFLFAFICYMQITSSPRTQYFFIRSARDSILALWPTFLCGAILAAIHTRFGNRIKLFCHECRSMRNGGADLTLSMLIFIMAIVLLKTAKLSVFVAYLEHFGHVAIEALLWTMIIAAVLYLPGFIRTLLINKFFTFLGILSYSLYLLHFPVMFFGEKYLRKIPYVATNLSTIEIIIICLVGGIILSMVTYYVIEKPMLNIKERVKEKATNSLIQYR